MTFLPIVERELRIAARLTATYRNRAVAAGLVMAVALVMLTFGTFARASSQAGLAMFHVLSFLTMLFCLLEGVRKTADCLSEEKREGTLGLLFLTDLKGYDVVLGKLAATSLNSFYGLLSTLPVLALPLLVGGITPVEYWRMVLALVNILFFSLCAGMLVSALCGQESRAMSATLLVVLFFGFVPGMFHIPALSVFSPAHAYRNASYLNSIAGTYEYWQSIWIAQAMSWLMLILASVLLPRLWQDLPSVKKVSAWRLLATSASTTTHHVGAQERAEMLDTNPALWLSARNSQGRTFMRIIVCMTVACSLICISSGEVKLFPAFIAYGWLINFIIKMRVASQACQCLAEARRNNALEMLLATPLNVNEIISGQLLALKRVFMWPVIAILTTEFCTVLVGMFIHSNDLAQVFAFDGIAIVFVIGYFGLFFLDILAVIWAGMWFGLTAKKGNQAVTKTILLVLVLPYVSMFFCWFGIPFYIGVPIFWLAWCSSRLKAEFRALAAQRFIPHGTGSGWLPGTGNRTPPPPILPVR